MSKLAINGGQKAITINQDTLMKWPIIPEDAIESVNDLLRDVPAKISLSSIVDFFSNEFAHYIGREYVVPECNGTAGLFSAFINCDIKPGDEVIVPSYTYWATMMGAAYLGAKIIFAEIDPITLCLDPIDVERKITSKTKAIVPVHVWGMPADMDRIMKVAKNNEFNNNIIVIEDASHAHGASYHGKKVGSIGDMSVFSLQGSKLMPAGEGGVFLTDNYEYYESAILQAHYERISSEYLDNKSPNLKYHRTPTLGLKFRMSPLHAAIALTYLENLDQDNKIRNENCNKFRKEIDKLPGFHAFVPDKNIERVYYENLFVYDPLETNISTKTIVEALSAEGALISENRYPLMHLEPYFVEKGYSKDSLPITEKATSNLLKAPNFYTKNKEIVDQYIEAFKKVADELL